MKMDIGSTWRIQLVNPYDGDAACCYHYCGSLFKNEYACSSRTSIYSGVETGGSGGSLNRGPELLGAPSGATKITKNV